MQRERRAPMPSSPSYRLLLLVLSMVVLAEAALVLLLPAVLPRYSPQWTASLLEAFLLAVILVSILWVVMVRPLQAFDGRKKVLSTVAVAVIFLTLLLLLNSRAWIAPFFNTFFLTAILAPILWVVMIRPLQGVAARENILSTIVRDTMVDGVIVADERGIIESCNAAAERIFGYSSSELVGQNVKILIPSPHREQHEHYMASGIRSGKSKNLGARRETVGQCKDGTIMPLDLAVRELVFGQRRWYIGLISDVTERKRVSQKLQEAKQAADAANHAKSEFLANMSHEIRTPMTAILGFTDLLRKGVDRDDPSERQDYLDTIHASGRHLLDLINDILDLSKIEAGQMKFERIDCMPSDLIAEVLSVLRVRAREKGLFLEFQWSGEMPETIQSDPARLRQLLINLVGNAIKFTETGGVRVVAAMVRTKVKPQLAIDVIDTGVGIAADKLESIFDPFVQADTSVTREFGGTGLGLAICRRIVEAFGGGLTVSSQVGEGSVFTVTIDTGPLDGVSMLSTPPAEGVRTQEPAAGRATSTLPTARILLVEDGATNRKLIGLILRRAGAEVATAENGELGVALATAGHFDLILMDMQMPVMDGYTATRRLRQQGMATPIIALTAHAMKGDEAKCRAAGCSGYLTKPIDADRLLCTVAEVVAGTDPQVSPAEPEPSKQPARRPELLSSLPMDDPEFREIVEEFVERLREQLDAMRAARAAGDLAELSRLAHWLKGAGGTAGFAAFTEPAKRLEQLVKSQQRGQIEAAIAGLAELAERIVIPAASHPHR